MADQGLKNMAKTIAKTVGKDNVWEIWRRVEQAYNPQTVDSASGLTRQVGEMQKVCNALEDLESGVATLQARVRRYEEHTGEKYPDIQLKGVIDGMLNDNVSNHVGSKLGDSYSAQDRLNEAMLFCNRKRRMTTKIHGGVSVIPMNVT